MQHRLSRLAPMFWCFIAFLMAFNFAVNLQQSGKTYLNAEAYTHYHEKRPYQYRVLMAPVLGGLIHQLSRPTAASQLAKFPVYLQTPEAAAFVLINGTGLAVSFFLMAAIARRSLGPASVRLVVAVYLGLVYLFLCLDPNVAFILPYDIPSLVLTQACLLAILHRRPLVLYLLFALAALNRETCFLVVVYLMTTVWRDGTWRPWAAHVAGLALVWVAIKTGLYLTFAQLPTDEGSRLAYNLRTLAKPWWWPALLPLLAAFATSAWSLREVRTQREWALTGCIGFVIIFTVGQILETRAFADLTTFFALAIGHWILQKAPAPLAIS